MGGVITTIGVVWTMIGVVAFGVGLARPSDTLLLQSIALGMFPGLVLVALGRITAYLRILTSEIEPPEEREEPMPDELSPADHVARHLVLVNRPSSEQAPQEKS